MPLTDWLLLGLFGVAWLAGWCSRWQWDRHNWEQEDEEPFDRWAMIERLDALDRLEHQRHWSHLRWDNQYDGLRWDADE